VIPLSLLLEMSSWSSISEITYWTGILHRKA
jgi:hypothetical protein